MQRGIAYLLLFFLFLGPVAAFLADISLTSGWGLPWLDDNIGFFKTVKIYYVSFILIAGGLVYLCAFLDDDIKKYRLPWIAGIIGIIISLISYSLSLLWPVFIWGALISGVLCFYAALTPIIDGFNKKVGSNVWEKSVAMAFVSFLFIYYTGYQSNILINNTFMVDARHFPYTRIVASIVILSPYAFFFSAALLCFACYKMIRGNIDGQQHFLVVNGFMASISLFIFSGSIVTNGPQLIKNVASVVDFNANSICANVNREFGVIYLDERYEKVLIDEGVKNSHVYKIMQCDIKDKTESIAGERQDEGRYPMLYM